MNWGRLDDGRMVIVDTSRQQVRMVKGKEYFLDPSFVNVLLDDAWAVVKKSRIKTAPYGNPFEGIL